MSKTLSASMAAHLLENRSRQGEDRGEYLFPWSFAGGFGGSTMVRYSASPSLSRRDHRMGVGFANYISSSSQGRCQARHNKVLLAFYSPDCNFAPGEILVFVPCINKYGKGQHLQKSY